MSDLCLAVDVGGTKIAAGLVDGDGAVVEERRRVTPAESGDPEEVFGVVAALVDELSKVGRPSVIGVGCGGPMRSNGALVSPLNIPAWRDFPLAARLADLTGLEVHVDNDAKALALAEWWKGGARGASTFLAVIVGTGVGGGLVVDGRLLDGDSGNAGHLGHVIVEPDGHPCACGSRGCLEAEASGSGIARITGLPASQAGPDVVERAGTMLGRAVASVAALLDTHLALVAGSVGLGFGKPFFQAAQAEIDRRARIAFARGCLIRPAELAERGPLVGAAAVGWRGAGCPGPWAG
jgi:glucokinase